MMAVDVFDQLEDKVKEAASEREELRKKVSEQLEELKRLQEGSKKTRSSRKETKERIDRLIRFLESLPIVKEK